MYRTKTVFTFFRLSKRGNNLFSFLRFVDACNFYILLWVIGTVQGCFFKNSLLSLSFSIPYLLMTMFYAVYVLLKYRLKGVMLYFYLFFIMLLIYGVFAFFMNDFSYSDKKSFLMMDLFSLGPVFAFYVFTKQGKLTEKRMYSWFYAFVVVATIVFVTRRSDILQTMNERYKYDDITNNVAYDFMGLFPFIFLLYRRTLVQYVSLLYIFVFVMFGMKRGAIFIFAVLLMWFAYVSFKKPMSAMRKLTTVLLFCLFVVFGYIYLLNLFENNSYFKYRIESTYDGNTSGRNYIYSKLWNHFIQNDNLVQLLFGEGGFHSEFVSGGKKAHCDWLELLIDCGVVGILLYAVYWICFFSRWRKCKRNKLLYSLMGTCFIFTFLRSLFSMSFGDMPFYLCVVLGYCLSKSELPNRQYNIVIQQKNEFHKTS